jgi:hypothetical protein
MYIHAENPEFGAMSEISDDLYINPWFNNISEEEIQEGDFSKISKDVKVYTLNSLILG